MLDVARLATLWRPASVTSRRHYVLKTADQLEEKKRRAILGGGQARIDKQHKTVSLQIMELADHPDKGREREW